MKLGYSVSYILFFLGLALGMIVVISTNNWLTAWVGLELNLLSFIPLVLNKFSKEEAVIKYFIVQVFASQVFIFTAVLLWADSVTGSCLFLVALALKLGMAPLHFWYPSVSAGCGWQENIILMLIQKVAPLHLMSYLMDYSQLVCFLIVCSCVVGALGGINQSQVRKLMAYSSINHLGWTVAAMFYSNSLWLTYYAVYCAMTGALMWVLLVNQVYRAKSVLQMGSVYLGAVISVGFLSLGGLPPFMGFIPKWLVLEKLLSTGCYFISLVMVMSSLLTLYFYLRLILGSMVFLKSSTLSSNFSMSWMNLIIIMMNSVGGAIMILM